MSIVQHLELPLAFDSREMHETSLLLYGRTREAALLRLHCATGLTATTSASHRQSVLVLLSGSARGAGQRDLVLSVAPYM
jgi:hypothetical protein